MPNLLKPLLAFLCALVMSSAIAQDQQQTDCDKYPGSLGCASVDVPTPSPIPSQTRNITLEAGPTFVGAGCPANVGMSWRGQYLTLLPMATACNWISSYVRPLMLLLAAISAVFIVMPSED